MLKTTVTRVLVLVAALTPFACNRAPATDGGGKPTIALVVKTLNNPFFIEMQKGAEEAAQKAGRHAASCRRQIAKWTSSARCRSSRT